MSSSSHPALQRAGLGCASGRRRRLDRLEEHLAAVTYGTEASTVDVTERRGLVLLPTVIWLPAPATWQPSHHGHLLPHHLRWSTQQRCIALPPGSHRLGWITTSWGRRLQGVVHLDINGDRIANQPHRIDDTQLHNDRTVTGGVMSPRSIKRQCRCLAADGNAARWALISELTPFVRDRAQRAAVIVGREFDVTGPILDALDLDAIVDTLVLGDRDTTQTSTLNRRIDRYAATTTRPAADFLRYVRTTIDRDAALAIRRRIDDPRLVGSALRRFRAAHPDLELDELLDGFNRTQPQRDRVSYDRAWRALVPTITSRAPTPTAHIDLLAADTGQELSA